MSQAPQQFDVFLSHHSGDKPWVIFLKSALEARGVKVWLDHDEIRPGDLFIDALEEGIQSSRCLALVISPESMKSAWVKEEYQRAMVLAASRPDLRIIPCVLRNAAPPAFLTIRHWVDFRDPKTFEDQVDELCWGVTGVKPGVKPLKSAFVSAPSITTQAEVSEAEIAFLKSSIASKSKDRRDMMVLRGCAPLIGLATIFLWGELPPALYLGSPLVTGFLGLGVTARKWSACTVELKRLIAHLEALELCRQKPAPVCSEVIEAFNRLIKQSIGIADTATDRS